MRECPRCSEIQLETMAKYLDGEKIWAEYECLECGHYEQMPEANGRKKDHEEYFMGYNAKYPARSGL